MFCTKCGAKLNNRDQFCKQCGSKVPGETNNALNISDTTYSLNRDKQEISWQAGARKTKIALFIALGALIIILGLVVISFPYLKRIPLNRSLSMGDKYLSELQYDNAIAAYKSAIEIDPKEPEGYIKLSNLYYRLANDCIDEDRTLANEYIELALSVLDDAEKNVEITDKGRIQKEIEDIKESGVYIDLNNNNEEPVAEIEENDLDIASEIIDVPYKGDANFELRYYPINTMDWGLTISDDDQGLLSAWTGDFDNDQTDEILAIVLKQDINKESVITLDILEKANNMWSINSEIEIPTRLFSVFMTKGRFDFL